MGERDRVWDRSPGGAAYPGQGNLCPIRATIPDKRSFAGNVVFHMITGASQLLAKTPSIRLVVIDEAHHGAANSYLPLFERPSVGVLGLTATPTRHDGKPLEFERESYSIGFPDLVDRGVILRPEVRRVGGGVFGVRDLEDANFLEALNTDARIETNRSGTARFARRVQESRDLCWHEEARRESRYGSEFISAPRFLRVNLLRSWQPKQRGPGPGNVPRGREEASSLKYLSMYKS